MKLLIQGNALHIPLADKSVQCVVTSPPYWGLRAYATGENKAHELGSEPLHDCLGWAKGENCGVCYVCHMRQVFAEVWRVLRDDGTVWLNLGDSMYSNPGNGRGGGSTLAGGKPHLSGKQRVNLYDTYGKEPEDYQDHGCLCESLCDVCRTLVSRISRTDYWRVATQVLSLYASSPEYKSWHDHQQTYDYFLREIRNSNASLDQEILPGLDAAPLLASLASRIGVSSLLPLAACLQRDSSSCAPSSLHSCADESHRTEDSYLPSTDKHDCICRNASRADQLQHHNQYNTKSCLLCGSSFTLPFDIEKHYTTSLKPKDLCGIPWRVALALQADGWYLRSDIIWAKPNPMPESVTDRPTKAHEYLFLLAKGQRYYWDAEAVREDAIQADRVQSPGSRSNGDNPDRNDNDFADRNKGRTFTHRNLRTVWNIATAPYSGAHFATFPPALAEKCILAGTSARGACPKCGKAWVRVVEKGYTRPADEERIKEYEAKGIPRQKANLYSSDGHIHNKLKADNPDKTIGWQPACKCNAGDPVPCIVLDPFSGSGTTVQKAIELGRKGIGTELSMEYINLSRERTSGLQIGMGL